MPNYAFIFYLMLIIGCYKEHSKQTDISQSGKIKSLDLAQNYNNSTEEFEKFLQKFNNPISLNKSTDLPEAPWGRRIPGGEIEPEFMNQFVLPCLDKYQNPADSLPNDLPKKSDAKTLKGFYLSELKHPKDTMVAALLIDLIGYQGKEQIQEWIILAYFEKHSGEALGYDIVAWTHEVLSSQIHGRLKMIEDKICLENLFLKDGLKVQKYLISLNNPVQKQNYPKNTLELSAQDFTKEDIRYQKYCDEITRTCVDLPLDVFVYAGRVSLENADEFFVSQDQQAQLEINRQVQMIDETYLNIQKMYKYHQTFLQEKGYRISYQYLGNDFFVLSGISNEHIIIYSKYLIEKGTPYEITLTYPENQKKLYNKIAEQIHASFQVKD
ncbi:MAG: hypothetical protein NW226_22935 [Microscillaceae bacterium]|nr:hypothetical protein [Microscillaceae bacterium]